MTVGTEKAMFVNLDAYSRGVREDSGRLWVNKRRFGGEGIMSFAGSYLFYKNAVHRP